jgi:hypothetical protein
MADSGSDKQKQLADEARPVFDKLRKALKQIQLYRHNVDRYGEYFEPFVKAIQDLLNRHNMISVKIDPVAYKVGQHVIFEDESKDVNLVYPIYNAGIRLLIFKNGITAEEVQKFFLLCMQQMEDQRKGRAEDIITQLWKAELECIEYVVVEGFKAVPDEEAEDVEIEVEKVVAYLYRQLQSNSDDYLRFARVSSEDLDLQLEQVDQMRGAVIQGQTATPGDKARIQQMLTREETRHLSKMVVVLFQLLELDTTEENFEDVAEAFVQLLDALILAENFTAIDQIRQRFKVSAQKTQRQGARDIIQRCELRFTGRMGESQRVQAIGTILNQGVAKDVDGIRRYLYGLGVDAIPALIEMLEVLQLLPNRRLVCDVLAELGQAYVDTFATRLTHPSSNLVKDMIYVIDKINPPNKFAIFASVLEHPNAILRLETLAVIGRNGTDECFDYIAKVVKQHPDAQMRSQAARMLPNFAAEKGAGLLLDILKNENFEKISDPEKKALYAAVVQMRAPATDAFLRDIFEQKSGIFAKKNVDERKLLAIGGFESTPSVPGLQLLVQVAQDTKRHSKDVCEAARAAAINVKARLLGS